MIASTAFSANVRVHNFSIQQDGEVIGRPLVLDNGILLPSGWAYLAVGGYVNLTDSEIRQAGENFDFASLLAPFVQLGEAGTIEQFAGLFDFDVTFSLEDDDPLIGKPVYIAIGDSPDHDPASANGWMIIRTKHVFAPDSVVPNLEIDLAAIDKEQVIVGCFNPGPPILHPVLETTFPTALSFPNLDRCADPSIKVSGIEVVGDRVRLWWKSQPGKAYAVEQSQNLAHFKTSIARVESGDALTETLFDRGAGRSSFLRVRAVE